MRLKADVSAGYTNDWRYRTADYKLPRERKTLILGGREENIGGAIAAVLKGAGHDVTMLDKDELDLTWEGQVDEFFQLDASSGYDTLVINAGMTHLDWFEDQPQRMITEVVEATLIGPMLAAHAWVKATMAYPVRKTLIFIGSMAYKNVLNGSAPYCAAKAGIAHLVECLGFELTPKGYRVYGVHPSNVQDAPMTEETIQGLMRYRRLTREEARVYWSTGLLMPHFLHRTDVAEMVAMLAEDKAGFLSGSNLDLKGGQR